MPDIQRKENPNRSTLKDHRLGTIAKELLVRFKQAILRPYVIPFLNISVKIACCTFVALFLTGNPIEDYVFWLFIASFSITYACLHLIYSLSELKTIARVLSLNISNRPRLPFILLGAGSACIITMQLLKASEKNDELPRNLYDGLTGIAASLVAAALYQILEMWRELREKRDGRQQLLYLLGIDEKKFSESNTNRVKIVLPGFKFDQSSSSDAYIGDLAFHLGARNRLGHKISSLCAAEDVEAFRVMTQLFQEREIPWELVYPEDIFPQKILNPVGIDEITDAISADFTFIPPGHYVAIGLYSNLLTMASNLIELLDSEGFLAYLEPFDENLNESPAIITRDDLIQTKTIGKAGSSKAIDKKKPSNRPYGYRQAWWRNLLRKSAGASENLDSCFIFRRIIPDRSLFIFGGISAPGTKACSAYLQNRWNELIRDIEIACERKSRKPSVAKFVRVFYANIDTRDNLSEFLFNDGFIDVD
jgi:hypothetical protein